VRDPRTFAVRLAVVVAAVALAVPLAGRWADARACGDARVRLFAAGLSDRPPPGGLGADARTVLDRCGDEADLAAAAVSLAAARAPEAADVGRAAVARAPEAYTAWAALEVALRGADPEGARRAEARARALNPRWPGPVRPPG